PTRGASVRTCRLNESRGNGRCLRGHLSGSDERKQVMCGIIGVASRHTLANREWLDAGCTAMAHRGPDDSGSWWSANGNVGLAQRRLAIIDLSPGGHQPMHHEGGRLSIVFNGEIYNYLDLRDQLKAKGHKFVTQSDTEVILAAYSEWGTDCLAHRNGMFAIGL